LETDSALTAGGATSALTADAVPSARRSEVSPRRHISASIRRAVYERDGGRCTFVSPTGRRCEARDALELNHRVPRARGGSSALDNLELRCRAHNLLQAEDDYGKATIRSAMDCRRPLATDRATP
jgi:5-methylcytosine-specific restriction endonuclease McrA